MRTLNDNKAETPIEVIFVVMGTILTMSLLVLTLGNFVDKFISVINAVDIPLSVWGQTMMQLLVIRYASWFYLVPTFMVLVVMVWGVKTVIKRHQYSTQDTQYMSDEF